MSFATRGIRHVFIRNLELPAHIGVYRQEEGRTQPVRINVDLATDDIAARAGAPRLQFADLSLDPDTREVLRAGRPISLTRTEFALLELLLANPRRVLSRAQILEQVWGYDFPTTGNALEVYIGYLRRKTEADGERRLIHTVRGVGYVLRESPP